jgi:cyclase
VRRLALLLSLLLSASAFAQLPDMEKAQIKATKVAGNIYMLEGVGGNIGVSAGADGILIVDDQFAVLAPKIKAALKGIVDKPVKWVINTHYHADHTNGNLAFGAESAIIAHENVHKRLAETGVTFEEKKPAPIVALPVLTFGESLSVWINAEEIKAIHLPPGHTDGDAIIHFTGSKVVHMGTPS